MESGADSFVRDDRTRDIYHIVLFI